MDAHSNRWLFSSTVIVVIRFLFWLSVWIWNWFMHAQHYLVPEHSSQPVKRFYDLVALLYSDAAKNRCKTPVHVHNNQPKKLSILQVEMHGADCLVSFPNLICTGLGFGSGIETSPCYIVNTTQDIPIIHVQYTHFYGSRYGTFYNTWSQEWQSYHPNKFQKFFSD